MSNCKSMYKQKRKYQVPADNKKDKPSKKSRPNYFIGIRLKKPIILGKVRAIQNHIKAADPRLAQSVVPISTIHITLGVFHIEENNVLKVADLLENYRSEVQDIVGSAGLHLELNGLGNFRNEVLFVSIAPGKDLNKLYCLSNLLVNCCSDFCEVVGKSFVPHITVMKLSKLRGFRHKKVKKIHPCLYEGYKDMDFGKEKAVSIQLLSMRKKKQPDGFYHCESQLLLDNALSIADGSFCISDWAECLAISCITFAIYLPKSSIFLQFSDFLSKKIVLDAVKAFREKGLVRHASQNDSMKTRLNDFKKIVNSPEVKEKILKQINDM